jgi:hypothetical protein
MPAYEPMALGLGSATSVQAIVKSDSTILSGIRMLYIGGAGDVAVTMPDGTTATFTGCAVGTMLPICPQKVNAATTASLILGLG